MTRSETLRRRSRRIFWYAMLAAAAIHVLIFVGSPVWEVEPLGNSTVEHVEGSDGGATGTDFVDVFFAPPEIVREDGTTWQEPPQRVLEARAVDFTGLDLPFECSRRAMAEIVPATGRVRLVLNVEGRVQKESVDQGTGDRCRDEMMTAIASKLVYEWLPDDRFPAPVELVQPMRVVAAVL